MSEQALGIKTEKEHHKTIKKLMEGKKYSLQAAAKMIALDHLKEHPKYYTRLRRAEIE